MPSLYLIAASCSIDSTSHPCLSVPCHLLSQLPPIQNRDSASLCIVSACHTKQAMSRCWSQLQHRHAGAGCSIISDLYRSSYRKRDSIYNMYCVYRVCAGMVQEMSTHFHYAIRFRKFYNWCSHVNNEGALAHVPSFAVSLMHT